MKRKRFRELREAWYDDTRPPRWKRNPVIRLLKRAQWAWWGWRVRARTATRVPRRWIQRAQRGWADEDAWSADAHFAEVALGMLTHIHGNATPPNMTDQEWDETLEAMIRGFKAALAMINEGDPDRGKRLQRNFDEGMELFTKHFFDLWY